MAQLNLTAIEVELQQPILGFECIISYTVEADNAISATTSNGSNSVILTGLDLCNKRDHNFTARGHGVSLEGTLLTVSLPLNISGKCKFMTGTS